MNNEILNINFIQKLVDSNVHDTRDFLTIGLKQKEVTFLIPTYWFNPFKSINDNVKINRGELVNIYGATYYLEEVKHFTDDFILCYCLVFKFKNKYLNSNLHFAESNVQEKEEELNIDAEKFMIKKIERMIKVKQNMNSYLYDLHLNEEYKNYLNQFKGDSNE